jgi:flagellar assembly factor FliW
METFRTIRFGELNYRPQDVIHLPGGLVGLPGLRRWLLLDPDRELPLKWLQSLDRPDFGMPVTMPEYFQGEYAVPITEEMRRRIGPGKPEDYVTLIITTVHHGGEQVTGNLLAPLVINAATRQGLQQPLDHPNLSLRQELDYFKFGLAVSASGTDNEVDSAPAEQRGSLQERKETQLVQL